MRNNPNECGTLGNTVNTLRSESPSIILDTGRGRRLCELLRDFRCACSNEKVTESQSKSLSKCVYHQILKFPHSSADCINFRAGKALETISTPQIVSSAFQKLLLKVFLKDQSIIKRQGLFCTRHMPHRRATYFHFHIAFAGVDSNPLARH